MPVIMLVDNGSTRPTATKQLRLLAAELGLMIQHRVHPISMQHANKIPADQLDGKSASIFSEFLAKKLQKGKKKFILLPLFFGKSRAITKFLPDEVEKLKAEYGDFSLIIAQPIYPLPSGDNDLVDIITDHIHQLAEKHNAADAYKNIVLVDHGSPVPRVTEVRQHLANAVREKLPDGAELEEAVMERREGKDYDFNGDLLKDWLTTKAQSGETHASVILVFFLPGSHAGKGGDIVEICDEVMQAYPEFKVEISPLISQHPKLVSILAKRLQSLSEYS